AVSPPRPCRSPSPTARCPTRARETPTGEWRIPWRYCRPLFAHERRRARSTASRERGTNATRLRTREGSLGDAEPGSYRLESVNSVGSSFDGAAKLVAPPLSPPHRHSATQSQDRVTRTP